MHKLIGAARRRTAGVAAGLILTGGVAGVVLLTAGAAYAATTATTTTVTAAAQGSAIDVTVSVSPSGATGSVSVSDGSGGCNAYVGMSGSGSCDIANVRAGTYTVTASYGGSGGFQGTDGFGPSSGSTSVTVAGGPTGPTGPTGPGNPPSGNAPVFSADSPATSVTGQSYSYQFSASGSPSYQLVGAPGWLSIGNNGMVSGYIPAGTNSFSFSVYAWNKWGHITAGPFYVFFRPHHHNYNYNNYAFVNLHTSLWCSPKVYTGGHGTCTLQVTNSNYNYPWAYGQFGQYNNFGQNFASDVTATINLPYQLRADCGYDYFYSNFCQYYGNSVSRNLGSLYPGQTKSLTVNFSVRSGFGLWGYHSGHSFYVEVTGSASAGHNNFFFYSQGSSYSTAYVKIVPRGFWW